MLTRALCILFGIAAMALAAALPSPIVKDAVSDKFIPASYGSQKIGGILGERMRVNLEGRLLHVDEAALLAGFRERPGVQAWIGEHIGKFLDAGVNTWRYTGDERLKAMTDRMTPALIATQLPDGYLGTYVEKKRWSSWDVWVHKYDLIGLLSYYQATGYAPALDASRKIGDLLVRTFGTGPGQLDISASGSHVGMASTSVLEPVAMLYRLTGDKRYLEFAYYITRSWDQPNGPKIIKSLLETGNVFKTADAKAYEMISNLVGLVDLYRLTGDETFLKPALIAWKDITARRLYITGTTSSKEHFLDDFDLPGDEKAKVGEGCATVTWLQLNWQLLRITGEAKYADELERTVYNQLLGAQLPENGNICYFTPLVGEKKPRTDINCCQSSEPRGISMIPQLAWGTREGAPVVLLYVPGELRLPQVTVKSTTQFPLDSAVTLTVTPAKPSRFSIWLRVPAWCTRYQASGVQGKPGGFVKLERKWKPGDRIEISMDLPVRVLPGGKSYPNSVAIQRGPQVLALEASLNPQLTGLETAALKSIDQVHVAAVPGAKQAYSAQGLVFVPFMDAQNYSVWIGGK